MLWQRFVICIKYNFRRCLGTDRFAICAYSIYDFLTLFTTSLCCVIRLPTPWQTFAPSYTSIIHADTALSGSLGSALTVFLLCLAEASMCSLTRSSVLARGLVSGRKPLGWKAPWAAGMAVNFLIMRAGVKNLIFGQPRGKRSSSVTGPALERPRRGRRRAIERQKSVSSPAPAFCWA